MATTFRCPATLGVENAIVGIVREHVGGVDVAQQQFVCSLLNIVFSVNIIFITNFIVVSYVPTLFHLQDQRHLQTTLTQTVKQQNNNKTTQTKPKKKTHTHTNKKINTKCDNHVSLRVLTTPNNG